MAVTVDVDLNRAEIYALLTNRARRIGNKVQRVAQRKAPKDSGKLAASIVVIVNAAPGFAFADIGSGLDYAIWRHEGTGVYGRGTPIVPVRAKVLRFRPGRRGASANERRRHAATPYVYRPRVAGTPGVPFLVDALIAVCGADARIRRFPRRRGR